MVGLKRWVTIIIVRIKMYMGVLGMVHGIYLNSQWEYNSSLILVCLLIRKLLFV